ncbi:acetyltransferase (GNAT) family protein [Sinobaca qinghaiensis]|uniref:Acetyltransferase (GNAT) family protein n=1 Tax=Sinobaca qinghaiensis TaxID=342944 RepID=A0A419UWU2_9BACL|nr:GNAT family N-acetyltransferase [Sinobaca qinghaiensis]RKD69600.1 acetyltransferase (GNAT) family protein [Sinobaca qinghaiensis]
MEQRVLNIEEIDLLESCLIELAAYHNKVSTHFNSIYPLKPYHETLNTMKKQMRESSGIVNGLLLDGEIIGFCKISFERKSGTLDYLYVNKKYRNRGYGRLLMDWAMKEFQRNDVEIIDLKIVAGNSADKMYKKYGFQPQLTVMSKIIE